METFTEHYRKLDPDDKAQKKLLEEERIKRLKGDVSKYVAIPITIPVKRRNPVITDGMTLSVEQALAWVIAVPGVEGQPTETREAMGLVFNDEQAAEDLTYSLNMARAQRTYRNARLPDDCTCGYCQRCVDRRLVGDHNVDEDPAPNPSPGFPALVKMEEKFPYYGNDS